MRGWSRLVLCTGRSIQPAAFGTGWTFNLGGAAAHAWHFSQPPPPNTTARTDSSGRQVGMTSLTSVQPAGSRQARRPAGLHVCGLAAATALAHAGVVAHRDGRRGGAARRAAAQRRRLEGHSTAAEHEHSHECPERGHGLLQEELRLRSGWRNAANQEGSSWKEPLLCGRDRLRLRARSRRAARRSRQRSRGCGYSPGRWASHGRRRCDHEARGRA